SCELACDAAHFVFELVERCVVRDSLGAEQHVARCAGQHHLACELSEPALERVSSHCGVAKLRHDERYAGKTAIRVQSFDVEDARSVRLARSQESLDLERARYPLVAAIAARFRRRSTCSEALRSGACGPSSDGG